MKKIWIHSIIWLGLMYFLFISLSMLAPWKPAIQRSFVSIFLMAVVFYTSGWGLAKQFLIKRNKPLLFVIFSLLLILLFSLLRLRVLNQFSINFTSIAPHTPDKLLENNNRFSWNSSSTILRKESGRVAYFLSFCMNSIILVIAVLFRLYENKSQKEQESREKLHHSQEAQILYLKSQVNPHFLFNTLNNLYGLTYSKSDLAPQMVLGLSDTMRYLIYETEQKLVPIEKEIHFIHNYLKLEKMRISYPENIRITIRVDRPMAYIPPLLLIPFIENCFKHGNIGKEEDAWMEIDISDANNSFYFVCKNSYSVALKNKTTTSGIGLVNVKKRLHLIFAENYELQTWKKEHEYMVSLQFPVFQKRDEL